MNKIPTRERCAACHEISAVGFHVPDDIWRAAVPTWAQNSVLCLRCFADFADAQLIAWDRHVSFYPVSLATHLSGVVGLRVQDIPRDIAPITSERPRPCKFFPLRNT